MLIIQYPTEPPAVDVIQCAAGIEKKDVVDAIKAKAAELIGASMLFELVEVFA